jgi:hypothetical protein
MRRRQRTRHLPRQRNHVARRKSLLPQRLLQRLSAQQLHHQVGPAALLPNVINRADIGVVQHAGGLRLAQKPPLRQGTGCRWRTAAHRRRRATAAKRLRQVALRDKLDRNLAAQPRILRPVDVAHAAGANLLQYPVRTELCSLRDCHAPQAGNDCKRIVSRKFTSLHPPPLCGNCARNGLLSVLTRRCAGTSRREALRECRQTAQCIIKLEGD